MLRLGCAYVNCDWYLLRSGMWRGECKFAAWVNGRLSLIAAATGSMRGNDLAVRRIFWNDKRIEHLNEKGQG